MQDTPHIRTLSIATLLQATIRLPGLPYSVDSRKSSLPLYRKDGPGSIVINGIDPLLPRAHMRSKGLSDRVWRGYVLCIFIVYMWTTI